MHDVGGPGCDQNLDPSHLRFMAARESFFFAYSPLYLSQLYAYENSCVR